MVRHLTEPGIRYTLRSARTDFQRKSAETLNEHNIDETRRS